MKITSYLFCNLNTSIQGTVTALAWFGLSSGAALATSGWQPETLRDISQLQVQVEKNCRAGASASRLREGIENYLSRGGIPINASRSSTGIQPHLYLTIDCQSNRDRFSYNVNARVYQPVNLNGRTVEAATYSVPGGFGTATTASYANGESDFITEILDDVIADWHSVR